MSRATRRVVHVAAGVHTVLPSERQYVNKTSRMGRSP